MPPTFDIVPGFLIIRLTERTCRMIPLASVCKIDIFVDKLCQCLMVDVPNQITAKRIETILLGVYNTLEGPRVAGAARPTAGQLLYLENERARLAADTQRIMTALTAYHLPPQPQPLHVALLQPRVAGRGRGLQMNALSLNQ